MGFFDRISDALDSGNREKKSKYNKGRKLYYDDQEAGVKMMTANARTANDYRNAANKQWEMIKDKSGRNAAFNDPEYKRLKKLEAEAEY